VIAAPLAQLEPLLEIELYVDGAVGEIPARPRAK
jgi:hypothetical protein